jgi:hypothetical protein
MGATRPAYQAIVDAAINATGASSGWLLADREEEGLIVLATAGQAATHQEIGAVIPAQGAKAYVLAAGQPTALLPQPGDTANADGGGAPGIPPSLLAVPCGDDDIVAVLEVSGKVGGATFGFDDINALSGLAQVAAAIVLERHDALRRVASPAQLGSELENLAQRLPARYENVARVIEALLSIET